VNHIHQDIGKRSTSTKFRSLFLAAGLLAAFAGGSSRAGIITTVPTGDTGPWGMPDSDATPTYGQVITIPAGDDSLISITFNIQNANGGAVPFQAYVYNWTGTAVTGGALFVSAPQSAAISDATYAPETVSLGNTPVTAGQQYLVAFSTLGFSDPAIRDNRFQTSSDTSYGLFEYNNSSTFLGLYDPVMWNERGNFGALAFTAVLGPLSAAPEPGSNTLLGIGGAFCLVGLAVRRTLEARRLQQEKPGWSSSATSRG
jgi:hypothetical protein